MIVSRAQDGSLGGRARSNNQEVDFEGDSFFFSYDDTRIVEDIKFEQGVDTPGMIPIKVAAKRIHYRAGEDEGEVRVPDPAG